MDALKGAEQSAARRISRDGQYKAKFSLIFPSLCILSDPCGLDLSVSLPAMSPTFLIINRLLIFQQRTEEHTLAERREVTLRLISAIVFEFGGTVFQTALGCLN